MDIFTFLNSTSVLFPYFERCVRQAMGGTLGPEELLAALRWEGKLAEQTMLAATGGVNTHKGAIFSMGLCCAALGQLPREQWGDPAAVLDRCGVLAQGLVEQDYRRLTPETACTAGETLYLRHGVTGVRGQAAAGFPAVRTVGLPTLEEGLAQGLSWNDAGCKALLALMGTAEDTNLMARGGLSGRRRRKRLPSSGVSPIGRDWTGWIRILFPGISPPVAARTCWPCAT